MDIKEQSLNLKSSLPGLPKKASTMQHKPKPVHLRDAMGHYLGDHPLTHLEYPTPGPATYLPNKEPKLNLQYSIQGRTFIDYPSTGPGPNLINDNLCHDEAPKYSIGKKLADLHKIPDFPSPSAYNDNRGKFGRNNDGILVSMSGWETGPIIEGPSPGNYNIKSEIGESNPKYSFGSKQSKLLEVTPGPLDYNVSRIKPNGPTAPSYTFSPSYKELKKDEVHYPAPNAYNPPPEKSEKAPTLKGYYRESKALKTPGPASYIIQSNHLQGPQFSLCPRAIPTDIQESPGPTSYETTKLIISKPSITFGAKLTINSKYGDVPAPNAYTPVDRTVRHNLSPKVSIKGKYKTSTDESSPGPAAYNIMSQTSRLTPAQLVQMEVRRRNNLEKKQKLEQAKINQKNAKEQKDSIKNNDYLQRGNTAPAFSLGRRLNSLTRAETPGPNYYNTSKEVRAKTSPGKCSCGCCKNITMKSRASPFVLVFPSTRLDTLRV